MLDLCDVGALDITERRIGVDESAVAELLQIELIASVDKTNETNNYQ